MTRTTKLWIRQGVIMVVAIPVVGWYTLWGSCFLLARYFDWKYPHDGQSSLAAFAIGLVFAAIAAGLTLAGLLVWTIFRIDRIETEGRQVGVEAAISSDGVVDQ